MHNQAALETATGKSYWLSGSRAPEATHVRVGCRVQITHNIYSNGDLLAVNGAFGTLEDVAAPSELVRCSGKKDPVRFRVRLDHGQRVVEFGAIAVCGTPKQEGPLNAYISARSYEYPLQPAYAVTIHRVQGQTLPAAIVDCTDLFDAQQFYTACSRVRTLHGLYVQNFTSRVSNMVMSATQPGPVQRFMRENMS